MVSAGLGVDTHVGERRRGAGVVRVAIPLADVVSVILRGLLQLHPLLQFGDSFLVLHSFLVASPFCHGDCSEHDTRLEAIAKLLMVS